jgi:hypothetical protein
MPVWRCGGLLIEGDYTLIQGVVNIGVDATADVSG